MTDLRTDGRIICMYINIAFIKKIDNNENPINAYIFYMIYVTAFSKG